MSWRATCPPFKSEQPIRSDPTGSRLLLCLFWGLVALLPSCGPAVIGAAASSIDDGGVRTIFPRSVAVEVANAKVAPAVIFFALFGPGDRVDVILEFESPAGSTPRDMTLRGNTNLSGLETLPEGKSHSRAWDFEADLGTTILTRNVLVLVTMKGGAGSVTAEATGDFGNDPPDILEASLPDRAEFEGSVDLKLVLSDSSMDAVDVVVEYNVVGDNPDTGFRVARSAGTPSRLPAEIFAFDTVPTSRGGTEYNFLWESDFSAEPPLDPSELQRR